MTGKELISIYSPDKKMNVIESKAWHGDSWDPLSYGRDYDFGRPFFEQIGELIHEVPFPAVNNWDAVNSDYCNFSKGNKNCYLVFGGDFNEDTQYSAYNFYTKNSSDLYWVNKGELCYELVDSEGNYRTSFGRYLSSCVDTHFGFELSGCQNCIGCLNLRNQSHCFFNQKLSAQEYAEKVKEIDFGSYRTTQELQTKFNELYKKSIFRPFKIMSSVNSTGDNIYNAKNCKNCFDIFDGAEDCKHILLAAGGLKDSYGCGHLGAKSELIYDSLSIYPASNVIASWMVIDGHHIQHSINITNCSNLFGCVGMRNKQYCILNKQYTKEEYEALVPKIVEHMKKMPYRGKGGRVYGYGEFFPTEISPFAYNETIASEYFPLTKEEVEKTGFVWKEREGKEYVATIKTADIPDNIKDVEDSILNEVVECEHHGKCTDGCTTAFKIIPAELAFYRHMPLPLPRLCPNCRNAQRIKRRNPPKLWHKKCVCAGASSQNNAYQNTVKHSHDAQPCPNEFETTYPPERPEIIYCEACYNAEVV